MKHMNGTASVKRKRGRGFYIVIAIGAIAGLLAISRVFAGTAGGGSAAIDTTGGSQATPSTQATQQATAQPTHQPTHQPSAQATHSAQPSAPSPHTPVLLSLSATQATLAQGPAILLNPGLVRQGSKVSATGFGFDAGAMLDLLVKRQANDQGSAVAIVKTDENGAFGDANFTLPDAVSSGSFLVVARERNSSKTAQIPGSIANGVGSAKLASQVGKPGDHVTVSLSGYASNENVNVFFNALTDTPVATLQVDGSGNIGQGSIRVPVGAVGGNVFLFSGAKSQTLATSPFYLLSLYPTLDLSSYAVKAAKPLGFSGKGFAPDEPVMVYLNGASGPALTTVQAGDDGSFSSPGFVLPYGLKGNVSVIALGGESRASVSAGFQLLPYTPDAQPSTYGGRPGTGLSFYATGFGPNEVVMVYVGRSQTNPGTLVSAFRVDGKGNAAAVATYTIPGDAPAGRLVFTLVGRESAGVATAVVSVQHSDLPVQVPAQPPYVLPPDLRADSTQPTSAPQATPSPSAPATTAPVTSPSAGQKSALLDHSTLTAAHASSQPHRSWWDALIQEFSTLWNSLTERTS